MTSSKHTIFARQGNGQERGRVDGIACLHYTTTTVPLRRLKPRTGTQPQTEVTPAGCEFTMKQMKQMKQVKQVKQMKQTSLEMH